MNKKMKELTVVAIAVLVYALAVAQVKAASELIDENHTYKLSTQYQGVDTPLDATDRTATLRKTDRVWQFVPAANGYYMLTTKFKDTMMCLDIYNDTFQAHLGECSNFAGQFWRVHSTQEGRIKLTNLFTPNLCLDVNAVNLAAVVSCEKSTRFWTLTKIGLGKSEAPKEKREGARKYKHSRPGAAPYSNFLPVGLASAGVRKSAFVRPCVTLANV